MSESEKNNVSRRSFLETAASTVAAVGLSPIISHTKETSSLILDVHSPKAAAMFQEAGHNFALQLGPQGARILQEATQAQLSTFENVQAQQVWESGLQGVVRGTPKTTGFNIDSPTYTNVEKKIEPETSQSTVEMGEDEKPDTTYGITEADLRILAGRMIRMALVREGQPPALEPISKIEDSAI